MEAEGPARSTPCFHHYGSIRRPVYPAVYPKITFGDHVRSPCLPMYSPVPVQTGPMLVGQNKPRRDLNP